MEGERRTNAGTRLVWVPPDASDLLADPPAELEVVPIPSDPRADARLAEVAFVVMPARFVETDPANARRRRPGSLFAGVWERMTSLEYVQVLSAGVDWIIADIPPSVGLLSARGAHDIPVSEWVLAAILAGLKDLGTFRDDMRDGRWDSRELPELRGSNVLLLGYGSIGRAVERRLEPFGPATIARIARHERLGVSTLDALPEVLPDADIVVVMLPLTDETRGVVDADFLARMKPGALLVNVARGKLVDTGALVEALRSGHVRAVLDVTDPEPLPPDHPLWQAPGLLVTPHIAGASLRLDARVATLVRDQLLRFSRGEPLINVVRDGY